MTRSVRLVNPIWALAVVCALTFSGCSGAPTSEGDGPTSGPAAPGTNPSANLTALAPTLQAGQSWTYRTTGYWDSTDEITVVVASAGPSGYLFAGKGEADLMDEVTWDRIFFGPMDRNLQHSGSAGLTKSQLLTFPMSNGTTWRLHGMNVTARPAEISTPSGQMPGFRILGAEEWGRVEVEYAPAIGNVVRYTSFFSGNAEPDSSLELLRTGNETSWVWFNRDAEVYAEEAVSDPAGFDPMNPQATLPAEPPAQLAVPGSSDVVVLWVIAEVGSKAIVTRPPPEQPWTHDGLGNPNFVIATLPATEGNWLVSGVAGGPTGWVYIQAHAIDWQPGP